MATSSDSLNSLVNLGNLIGNITGRSGSQTKTSTTKGNITKAGADRIIQQILAGRGGVKDISGAARGAGLFDSSTEAQLLNDLNARVAGEVAARQAGTTTTETSDLNQEGIGLGSLATPLIGAAVIRPILSSLLGEGTEEAAGTAVNQALTSAPVSSGAAPITASSGFTAGGNLGNSLIPTIGTSSGLGVNLGGAAIGGSGALSGLGGASGLAADLGLSAAEPGVATAVSQVGANAGAGAVPIIGNVLSGLFGGGNGDPFGSPVGFGASALGGAAALGPAGLIAAPVAAVFGSMLNDLGVKSIICTALQARGLLDPAEYARSQAQLATLNPDIIRGYHAWAYWVAKKIEEGNKFAIMSTLPWARSRTKLYGSNSNSLYKYLKYPLGTLTVVIGEPICWCIGKLISLRGRYGLIS